MADKSPPQGLRRPDLVRERVWTGGHWTESDDIPDEYLNCRYLCHGGI